MVAHGPSPEVDIMWRYTEIASTNLYTNRNFRSAVSQVEFLAWNILVDMRASGKTFSEQWNCLPNEDKDEVFYAMVLSLRSGISKLRIDVE